MRILPGLPAKEPRLAPQGENRTREERSWLRYAGVGVQFGAAITLFTLVGVWLDRRYPSLDPLFTLIGAGVGILGGMATLIYEVLGNDRKKTRE